MSGEDERIVRDRLAAISALNVSLHRFDITMRMAASLRFVDDETLSRNSRENYGANALMQSQLRRALLEATSFSALLEAGLTRLTAAASQG